MEDSARAEIAAELIASLDGEPDDDADAAWASEIERRAERAGSGEDSGPPWGEVREEVKAALEES